MKIVGYATGVSYSASSVGGASSGPIMIEQGTIVFSTKYI